MNSTVKRYAFRLSRLSEVMGGRLEVVEYSGDGIPYVLAADYDALEAECEMLRNTTGAREPYPQDYPLHKAVFMARESYTGDETFEDGVLGLIAELKDARKVKLEAQRLRDTASNYDK